MTDPKPNLILIGLRASGKSTIGARLADSLGAEFVDLDDVSASILNTDGAGEAIETHGIEAFRGAEVKALDTILQQSGQVIALGGGTPTAPGASELLAQSGCQVVYLRAMPETLQDRLRNTDNTDRPALVGDDVIDEVQTLFDQRDGLYRELAESVIHVDGVREESVVAAALAVAKAGV